MKRFRIITIKTDPDTEAELEKLRHTYSPPKSISEMGHILLRNGIERTKKIREEAINCGYTNVA